MRGIGSLGGPLAVAAALVVGTGWADDAKFKSGLQPGDGTSAFNCRDITGPDKGKSLCLV